MRTKSTGGFTLIELLIVIAIIGILAAVLIPNLMNARRAAAERAAQAHTSNVYTSFIAALADEPTLDAAAIITSASGTDCEAAGTVGRYSWVAGPAMTSCTIAAAGTTDFTVRAVINGITFENGRNVTAGGGGSTP